VGQSSPTSPHRAAEDPVRVAAPLVRASIADGAELRSSDLRGGHLGGADLGGSALHGADLRETLVGNRGLGHRGGDPELTFIFDPEIWGSRADDETRWPSGFPLYGAGVVFDGPDPIPWWVRS
jgi:hypothetical protein